MKLKTRNRLLVIDIEATCWQKPSARNISEIIEIGITELVRMESSWKVGASESIAITNVFSHVSPFCTHLTGWTQAQLDKEGIAYCDAMRILRKRYKSKESIIACWGKYDDKMFQQMSKMHKCGYPFNNEYLNVKALFGAKFGGVTSVEGALAHFDMEFIGRPHSGVDDSKNIARILMELLK